MKKNFGMDSLGFLREEVLHQYCEKIKITARDAGKHILTYFQKQPILLAHKSDASPLTLADLESHQFIVKNLEALNSSIPIISEEGPLPSYEERKDWRYFWLVDPLDGTKEFLNGRGDFTVNIALIENQEPILGVIYWPVKDLLYYAIKNRGSWKQQGMGESNRIFSTFADLNKPLTLVESNSHRSDQFPSELKNFLKTIQIKKRIRAGSSLKFCLVAEGSADIYPRVNPTMEWDVAAGDCIYRNSGSYGQRRSPLVYNKPQLKNGAFMIGLEFESDF